MCTRMLSKRSDAIVLPPPPTDFPAPSNSSECLMLSSQFSTSRMKAPSRVCPKHGMYFGREELTRTSPPRKLVIFRDYVYDVTNFHHPGGDRILSQYYGKDITIPFVSVGHSASAEKMLAYMCVGIYRRHEAEEKALHCTCNEVPTDALLAASVVKRRAAESRERGVLTADVKSWKTGEDPDAHTLLDLSAPLVPQVYKMSNKEYQRVIDTPLCKKEVFRLLPWDRLEPFTKTEWWLVPLTWLPVVGALSYTAQLRMNTDAFVTLFLLGIAFWTLLEYCLHRFVFHFPETKLPDWGWVRVVHFLVHAVHHLLPMDPLRLVIPPVLFILLAIPVIGATMLVLPNWIVHGMLPGGILGYIGYDMIHYTTHHFNFLGTIPYVDEMKRYHMKHHFKSPSRGFGVSSKIWDYAFGTLIQKQ